MIGDIIHRQLLEEYQNEVKRDYLGISQVGYCAQKQRFQIESGFEKKDMPQRTLIRFMVGNAVHAMILSLLWKARGKEFTYRKGEKEVTIETAAGNIMKGHLDLRASRDGIEFVCDLKIVNANVFRMIQNEPHKHYVDQVMIYADAEGVSDCLITYLCSETGEVKEHPFKVSPERIVYLKQKRDDIVTGDIERYQCPEGKWECNYCEFSHQCPIFQAANPQLTAEKTNEVCDIPFVLEMEFSEASRIAKEAQEYADSVKARIIESIPEGSKGLGTVLRADYIQPSVTVSYDKKKLEALVPAEYLDLAKKETKKKGYYRIAELRNG